MNRVADLENVRAGLVERMASTSSDQNYAVMGRLLVEVVSKLDELGAGPKKETGLSDFEKRLRDRQQGAKTPRRARGG